MSFRWTQVDEKFTGVIEDKIFEIIQNDKCEQIEYKCYFNEKINTKNAECDITSRLND